MDEIPFNVNLPWSAILIVMDQHRFGEATGGYTECTCGWPTEEQWKLGEPEMQHVLEILEDLSDKLKGI